MEYLVRFLVIIMFLPTIASSAKASSGENREQLLQHLKNGGMSIVFQVPDAPMGGDLVLSLGRDFSVCEDQRTLGQRGKSDADIIGKALLKQSIPVGYVHGSQYCRAKDSLTRILPNKSYEPDSSLNDICIESAKIMHANADALTNLLKQPVANGNRVIMTHQCNVRFVLRNQLTKVCDKPGRLKAGEAAVVDQTGQIKGCLSIADFYALAGEDIADRPAQLAPR